MFKINTALRIVALIQCSSAILINGLLLIGCVKKKSGLFLPWLTITMLEIILNGVMAIVLLGVGVFVIDSEYNDDVEATEKLNTFVRENLVGVNLKITFKLVRIIILFAATVLSFEASESTAMADNAAMSIFSKVRRKPKNKLLSLKSSPSTRLSPSLFGYSLSQDQRCSISGQAYNAFLI